MPGHRACGVGLVKNVVVSFRGKKTLFFFFKLARTIPVVFAAKLLKKLILHALGLLSLPGIKAFAGTCALSTIALLQKLQCPIDEFFRYHTQLQ